MLEKLKKKSIKSTIPIVIVLCVIGVALIVLEFQNLIAVIRGPVVFEDLEPDEIKGTIVVDASITANFGAFFKWSEKNTQTNRTRTTSVYYIIWTGTEDSEDYRYMAIKVPASDERKMEVMADNTNNNMYSDPIKYSGAIKKMPSKEYEAFREVFEESGWTDEEIDEGTLPYYINVGALTDSAGTTVFVIFGTGIVLVLIGLLLLIHAMTGGNLKSIKKELASLGLTETEADYEYECARAFNKKGNLRISSKLTFFMLGKTPHVLLNDKVVWVYQMNTTTNSVTTYELRFFLVNNRNPFHIAISNSDTGTEALRYIAQTMPKTIVGYSEDLLNMFQRDYQGFLNLKYNRPVGEAVPIGLENLKLF